LLPYVIPKRKKNVTSREQARPGRGTREKIRKQFAKIKSVFEPTDKAKT